MTTFVFRPLTHAHSQHGQLMTAAAPRRSGPGGSRDAGTDGPDPYADPDPDPDPYAGSSQPATQPPPPWWPMEPLGYGGGSGPRNERCSAGACLFADGGSVRAAMSAAVGARPLPKTGPLTASGGGGGCPPKTAPLMSFHQILGQIASATSKVRVRSSSGYLQP